MSIVFSYDDFLRQAHDGHEGAHILVEGDSWANHPFIRDLSDQTHGLKPSDYLVLNLAKPGDKAFKLSDPNRDQYKLLRRILCDKHFGSRFHLILFSIGGNDLVGPDMRNKSFLYHKKEHPYLQGRQLLTPNYYREVQNVVDGYRRLLGLIRKGLLNADTPVLLHPYSYLKPRKAGVKLGPWRFGKGWIQLHMEHFAIKDEDEQQDILYGMLDALYERMKTLEQSFERVLVANTLKCLSKDGRPNLEWWEDEMHPTSEGFRRVALALRREGRAAGYWPD